MSHGQPPPPSSSGVGAANNPRPSLANLKERVARLSSAANLSTTMPSPLAQRSLNHAHDATASHLARRDAAHVHIAMSKQPTPTTAEENRTDRVTPTPNASAAHGFLPPTPPPSFESPASRVPLRPSEPQSPSPRRGGAAAWKSTAAADADRVAGVASTPTRTTKHRPAADVGEATGVANSTFAAKRTRDMVSPPSRRTLTQDPCHTGQPVPSSTTTLLGSGIFSAHVSPNPRQRKMGRQQHSASASKALPVSSSSEEGWRRVAPTPAQGGARSAMSSSGSDESMHQPLKRGTVIRDGASLSTGFEDSFEEAGVAVPEEHVVSQDFSGGASNESSREDGSSDAELDDGGGSDDDGFEEDGEDEEEGDESLESSAHVRRSPSKARERDLADWAAEHGSELHEEAEDDEEEEEAEEIQGDARPGVARETMATSEEDEEEDGEDDSEVLQVVASTRASCSPAVDTGASPPRRRTSASPTKGRRAPSRSPRRRAPVTVETHDPDESFVREVREKGWDRMPLDSPVKTIYLAPQPSPRRARPRAATTTKSPAADDAPEARQQGLKQQQQQQQHTPISLLGAARGHRASKAVPPATTSKLVEPRSQTAVGHRRKSTGSRLSLANVADASMATRAVRRSRGGRLSVSILTPPRQEQSRLSETPIQPDSPGDDPLLLHGPEEGAGSSGGASRSLPPPWSARGVRLHGVDEEEDDDDEDDGADLSDHVGDDTFAALPGRSKARQGVLGVVGRHGFEETPGLERSAQRSFDESGVQADGAWTYPDEGTGTSASDSSRVHRGVETAEMSFSFEAHADTDSDSSGEEASEEDDVDEERRSIADDAGEPAETSVERDQAAWDDDEGVAGELSPLHATESDSDPDEVVSDVEEAEQSAHGLSFERRAEQLQRELDEIGREEEGTDEVRADNSSGWDEGEEVASDVSKGSPVACSDGGEDELGESDARGAEEHEDSNSATPGREDLVDSDRSQDEASGPVEASGGEESAEGAEWSDGESEGQQLESDQEGDETGEVEAQVTRLESEESLEDDSEHGEHLETSREEQEDGCEDGDEDEADGQIGAEEDGEQLSAEEDDATEGEDDKDEPHQSFSEEAGSVEATEDEEVLDGHGQTPVDVDEHTFNSATTDAGKHGELSSMSASPGNRRASDRFEDAKQSSVNDAIAPSFEGGTGAMDSIHEEHDEREVERSVFGSLVRTQEADDSMVSDSEGEAEGAVDDAGGMHCAVAVGGGARGVTPMLPGTPQNDLQHFSRATQAATAHKTTSPTRSRSMHDVSRSVNSSLHRVSLLADGSLVSASDHGADASTSLHSPRTRAHTLARRHSDRNPVIEVSSLDSRAAARAAACLILNHDYIRNGSMRTTQDGGDASSGRQQGHGFSPDVSDADASMQYASTDERALPEILMDEEVELMERSMSRSRSRSRTRLHSVSPSKRWGSHRGTTSALPPRRAATPSTFKVTLPSTPATPFMPGAFPGSTRKRLARSSMRPIRDQDEGGEEGLQAKLVHKALARTGRQRPSPRHFRITAWVSLENVVVGAIRHEARVAYYEGELDSVDAQKRAAMDLDRDVCVAAFYEAHGVGEAQEALMDKDSQWSELRMQHRCASLQRRYLRKLEQRHPGTLQGEELAMIDDTRDASIWRKMDGRRGAQSDAGSIVTPSTSAPNCIGGPASRLATNKQKTAEADQSMDMSFGTPFRRGAHSTPAPPMAKAEARLYPSLPSPFEPSPCHSSAIGGKGRERGGGSGLLGTIGSALRIGSTRIVDQRDAESEDDGRRDDNRDATAPLTPPTPPPPPPPPEYLRDTEPSLAGRPSSDEDASHHAMDRSVSTGSFSDRSFSLDLSRAVAQRNERVARTDSSKTMAAQGSSKSGGRATRDPLCALQTNETKTSLATGRRPPSLIASAPLAHGKRTSTGDGSIMGGRIFRGGGASGHVRPTALLFLSDASHEEARRKADELAERRQRRQWQSPTKLRRQQQQQQQQQQ